MKARAAGANSTGMNMDKGPSEKVFTHGRSGNRGDWMLRS